MLLFRSEEHIDAWYGRRGVAAGTVLTLNQQWEVARIWYSDLMTSDWRQRMPEEAEAVFASLGLTGEFWRLTSP